MVAVDRRDDAGHDVVDVGEVPVHPAVAEDVHRLAAQQGAGEEKQRHVGPAPGAVDREEPQARDPQAVEVVVNRGHQLVHLLRRAVERALGRRAVRLAQPLPRAVAVDRTARGVDQAADLVVAAQFKDVGESLHVVAHELIRLVDRMPHSGLGRQVAHPRLRARGAADEVVEGVLHGLAITDVGTHEAEVGLLLEDRVAPLLEPGVVVRVEVVVADHLVAALEQGPGDMKADESGAAGQQDSHETPPEGVLCQRSASWATGSINRSSTGSSASRPSSKSGAFLRT